MPSIPYLMVSLIILIIGYFIIKKGPVNDKPLAFMGLVLGAAMWYPVLILFSPIILFVLIGAILTGIGKLLFDYEDKY